MRKSFLFLFVFFIVLNISYNGNSQNSKSDEIFSIAEKMPTFPGGEVALKKKISSMVVYPQKAAELGIQGKVYISFVVNKMGAIENITVARSVDPLLDNEAVRVIESIDEKWTPGEKDGKKVNVSYTVPINFSFSGSKSATKIESTKEDVPVNKHIAKVKDSGYGVVFVDTLIDNETPFILIDKDIAVSRYAYNDYKKLLYVLCGKEVKVYDLQAVSSRKDGIEESITFDFDVDMDGSGLAINPTGKFMALIDKEKIVHLIDLYSKKEVRQVKLKKGLKNFDVVQGKVVEKSNPFVFKDDQYLLVGGTKNIAFIDVTNGKLHNVKLQDYEDISVSHVLPSLRVVKTNPLTNKHYIYHIKTMKSAYVVSNDFLWEDHNFSISKGTIIRKKSKKKLEKSKYPPFRFYDIFKKAYLGDNAIHSYEKEHQVEFPEIEKMEYLNNYHHVVAIKKGGTGFQLYDYSKIEEEIAKQYYLHALQINSQNGYEQYLKDFPYSRFAPICQEKLEKYYEIEYHNLQRPFKLEELEAFISKYPKSDYCYLAKKKADSIYRKAYDHACEINTIEGYNKYLKKYKKSEYISKVRSKVDEIIEKERDEVELFEKASNKSFVACIDYLEKYPNGKYVNEVKAYKKVFDDRLLLIEKNKNTDLWRLGNKICLLEEGETSSLLCGVLDAWNEDKSMAKIKLHSGMWDGQKNYQGEELVKDKYLWINPKEGWHLAIPVEIELLLERSNMPGAIASGYQGAAGNGQSCYWNETLIIENNDGSLLGALTSSLTNIQYSIRYTGVIENQIGDNYKIIVTDARVKLGSWASVNQLKYKNYANEKVLKHVGQTRVIPKSEVSID